MRVVVVIIAFAAILPCSNFLLAQELDSIFLSSAEIGPSDTAIISLQLVNESFSVGGFCFDVSLPDSNLANFVSIEPGSDVNDFAYFNVNNATPSTAIILGLVNMPTQQGIPLSCGLHEIALLKIVVADTISRNLELPIIFSANSRMGNAISDTTGYQVVFPVKVNGVITVTADVGIDDEAAQLPLEFELLGNYPNPFNSHTIIKFSLNMPGQVSIAIYDIQGRKVRNLTNSYYETGNHQLSWDACADDGAILSSGIYLYNIIYNGRASTGKMSFLK